MKVSEHDVVPTMLCPGDPCSGDEALPWEASHRSYLMAGGTAGEAEVAAMQERFERVVLEILGGERSWDDPELADLARGLALDTPVKHDTRPPRSAEVEVPDEVLCDVTEDLLPDLGLLGERVTGDDRPMDVVMAAVMCFVPFTEDGRRPLDWWADEETDRPLVRSARVIDGSPPCLWRDGVPLLPLAPRRVPDPAGAPRGVIVGRAYLVGERWAWSSCLPLPRPPAIAPLERRLTLELWRHRLADRRRTWEDMLRLSPAVVYRACCEGSR